MQLIARAETRVQEDETRRDKHTGLSFAAIGLINESAAHFPTLPSFQDFVMDVNN